MSLPWNPPPFDQDPKVRNDYFTQFVDELELTYVNAYDPTLHAGYTTATQVFTDFYFNVIRLIDRIYDDQCSDDAIKPVDAPDHPLRRALFLLSECDKFVRQNGDAIGGFYRQIETHLEELGRKPWTHFDDKIPSHMYRMLDALVEIEPAAEQAWVGGDLVNSDEFQGIYQEFRTLEDKVPRDEWDRHGLISNSQRLLRSAFKALSIPPDLSAVPQGLFDPNQTPTYVEFPHTSQEFLYGRTGRPGILSVKAKLGGPLTEDEQARVNTAARRRGRDEDDGDSPEERARRRRRRRNPGYTMKVENVDADILNIQCDARHRVSLRRPNGALDVTPIHPYPEATMDNYATETSKFLDDANVKFFNPDRPPADQAARDDALRQLQTAIDATRNEATTSEATRGNIAQKRARLAVFKVRYLRALYMKIILTEDPPVSYAVMRQALHDRLEDLKFHELIWSSTDRTAMNAKRTTRHAVGRLQPGITARLDNITRWNRMQRQLNGDPPTAEDIAAGDAAAGDDGDGDDAENDEGRGEEAPQQEPERNDSWGDHMLRRILSSARPGTDYFWSQMIEIRRERWWRAVIDARVKRQPLPPRPNLRDIGAGPFVDGGPEGFKDLPLNSVWERLQFMIVLTHWRLYQARLLS